MENMSNYDLSSLKDEESERFFRISDVDKKEIDDNAIPPQARDEDKV